jgi:hypothetical protein
MSALSPAAQAVLDAFSKEPTFNADGSLNVSGAIAAALRAAADQVVPAEDEVMRHAIPDAYDQRQDTRAELLAIAAELDGGTTSQEG